MSIKYCSADTYNTYIMYSPVDVRWHVLNDIMSEYYLRYYHILGLNDVCPDCMKFQNFRPLEDRIITTVDGCSLKAVSVGDVCIKLLNGTKQTPALLKNVVFAPDMAFTLISV